MTRHFKVNINNGQHQLILDGENYMTVARDAEVWFAENAKPRQVKAGICDLRIRPARLDEVAYSYVGPGSLLQVGQPITSPDPADELAALDQALTESYKCFTGPVSVHALAYARALVLSVIPDAAFIVTDDSDQGPGYTLSFVERTNGDEVPWDDDVLDDVNDELWRPLSDLRAGEMETLGVDPYRIPTKEMT